MAKAGKRREPVLIDVGDEQIDIATVLPFKISTWRRLKTERGIDLVMMARAQQRGDMEVTPLFDMAVAAIQLAEPSLTVEFIEDNLTFADVNKVAAAVMQAEAGDAPVDRPTSTASSSSPSDGDGDPSKLAA